MEEISRGEVPIELPSWQSLEHSNSAYRGSCGVEGAHACWLRQRPDKGVSVQTSSGEGRGENSSIRRSAAQAGKGSFDSANRFKKRIGLLRSGRQVSGAEARFSFWQVDAVLKRRSSTVGTGLRRRRGDGAGCIRDDTSCRLLLGSVIPNGA